jgi:hypothetical protein
MADTTATKITITGTERQLRALVRNALREGVTMTGYEEQCIEEAFLRFVRAQQPAARDVNHG